MTLFQRYSPALAFVLFTLIVALIVSNSAQRTLVSLNNNVKESCERVNILRAETNRRVAENTAQRDILDEFLLSARDARLASGTPSDIMTARQYSNLAKRLEKVTYIPVPITDCDKEFPTP